MSISNRKRKFIERWAGKKSAAQLAEELNLSISEVEKALGVQAGSSESAPARPALQLAFWTLLTVVFLAPFPMLRGNMDVANLPKTALIQTGAFLLLSLWFIDGIIARRLNLVRSGVYLPAAAFLVWSLLSLTWSLDKYGGFIHWIHWFACGIIFLVAAQVLDTRQKTLRLFQVLTVSGGLVSLLGIGQHLLEIGWFEQAAPPGATFSNKNMAAQYIVCALPAAIGLFLLSTRRAQALFAAGVLALMLAFVFYTFTRASWLGAIACFGVYALWLAFSIIRKSTALPNLFSGPRIAGAALAAVMMLAALNLSPEGLRWRGGEAFGRILGSIATEEPEDLGESGEDELDTAQSLDPEDIADRSRDSVRVRYTLWQNALNLIRERPIHGVGLANFKVHYPRAAAEGPPDPQLTLTRHPRNAHNDHLQLATELGIAGALLFGWLGASLLSPGARFLTSSTSSENHLIAVACLAGIAGILVNALFSFCFYLANPPLALALFAAILVRSGTLSETGIEEPSHSVVTFENKTPVFAAGAALALVVLVFNGQSLYGQIMADKNYKAMRRYLSEQNWEAVTHFADRALKYSPRRADLYYIKGWAQLENNQPKGAARHLARYRESYPYALAASYLHARALIALEEHTAALPLLELPRTAFPDDARMPYLAGIIHEANGDDEQALAEYSTAFELNPNDPGIALSFANKAYVLKQMEQALKGYLRLIELDTHTALAHYNAGVILLNEFDSPTEALPYLKKTLELNPGHEQAARIRRIIAKHKE